MKITEVHIFPHDKGDKKLCAFSNITFDDCFVVRGLKVIDGQKGLFVVMPSRKVGENQYRDVAHPITQEFRQIIQKAVLDAYEEHMEKGGAHEPSPHHEAPTPQAPEAGPTVEPGEQGQK